MIYYTYDDKGAIMGMIYGGQDYIFSKNLQGDVIGIYSGGALVAKYEYNAYGEIIYYGQGGKYELYKVVTFLYCGGEKVLGTTYYP